jgi:hypothetical protein
MLAPCFRIYDKFHLLVRLFAHLCVESSVSSWISHADLQERVVYIASTPPRSQVVSVWNASRNSHLHMSDISLEEKPRTVYSRRLRAVSRRQAQWPGDAEPALRLRRCWSIVRSTGTVSISPLYYMSPNASRRSQPHWM